MPILVVGLIDGNGNLLASQPYNEFQYGRRSSEILIPVRGQKLLAILQDDIGNISYEDNRLVLKHIIHSNVHMSAMTLLGKIAEAVLVRRCAENEDLNRALFQAARRKGAHRSTVARYVAIGTGLKPTQIYHPRRYNPSDPQRDIIWVDQNDVPALMAGSTPQQGVEAGLQVKASSDGFAYIYQDIVSSRYEVPIIYFPIMNDFERLADRLVKDRSAKFLDPSTGEYRDIRIGEDLIDARAYDIDAFEEVKDYYPIIYDLLNDQIDLVDLVDIARGNPTLENTMMMTAINSASTDTIILR